ncbi:lITAF domain-containing protein isoform X2 [Cynoglossus semilaevis]|nr:cell death-inducing p53-target protein 1 isoform X2 [Cynoglossus semilaevis]
MLFLLRLCLTFYYLRANCYFLPCLFVCCICFLLPLTLLSVCSTMSADGKTELPPYILPEAKSDGVKIYHLHTPFTPTSPQTGVTASGAAPVYTGGGGTDDGKHKFVSYDSELGRNPGMTTCTTCQQQVLTNVTYKAGTYAWLMCLLFICCGLVLCCCLIPFFLKNFKDAYHTCPRCNRILHVDKKKCCK